MKLSLGLKKEEGPICAAAWFDPNVSSLKYISSACCVDDDHNQKQKTLLQVLFFHIWLMMLEREYKNPMWPLPIGNEWQLKDPGHFHLWTLNLKVQHPYVPKRILFEEGPLFMVFKE